MAERLRSATRLAGSVGSVRAAGPNRPSPCEVRQVVREAQESKVDLRSVATKVGLCGIAEGRHALATPQLLLCLAQEFLVQTPGVLQRQGCHVLAIAKHFLLECS